MGNIGSRDSLCYIYCSIYQVLISFTTIEYTEKAQEKINTVTGYSQFCQLCPESTIAVQAKIG